MALSISVLAVLGGVALFQKHHVLALFDWMFTYPILTIYLLGGLRGTLLTSFVLALFLAIRLFAPRSYRP